MRLSVISRADPWEGGGEGGDGAEYRDLDACPAPRVLVNQG